MGLTWKATLLPLLWGSAALPLEAQFDFTLGGRPVQIHSFASQGFAYSNQNNYLTMKTSRGTFDMTDVGVNVSIQLTDKLRIGAQAYDRDFGSLGQWHPQLDWAVADYRFKDWFGIRGGVVKTVFGLENDTQDVDALHTFALLPQSVYPTDLRDSLLRHRGGDVYGDIPLKRLGALAYTAYAGLRQDGLTSESAPGARLRGQVDFLEPMVNAQTRTTVARIEVSNPGMRLRPGMFVQVRFALSGEHALAVPRSAVVDTGTRKLVYVAKGNGVFEAHEVQLGPVADDYYPVSAGLREGDRIVTEGNFLLDSQTRISGGMSGLFGGSKEFNQQQAAPESAQFKVSFRSDPATPQGGTEATVHVSVKDAAGKPVTDAQVHVTLFMPAMPAMGMGEMREAATLTASDSEYAGRIKVPTPGTWTVTVEVNRGGQRLTNYRTSLNAK